MWPKGFRVSVTESCIELHPEHFPPQLKDAGVVIYSAWSAGYF